MTAFTHGRAAAAFTWAAGTKASTRPTFGIRADAGSTSEKMSVAPRAFREPSSAAPVGRSVWNATWIRPASSTWTTVFESDDNGAADRARDRTWTWAIVYSTMLGSREPTGPGAGAAADPAGTPVRVALATRAITTSEYLIRVRTWPSLPSLRPTVRVRDRKCRSNPTPTEPPAQPGPGPGSGS